MRGGDTQSQNSTSLPLGSNIAYPYIGVWGGSHNIEDQSQSTGGRSPKAYMRGVSLHFRVHCTLMAALEHLNVGMRCVFQQSATWLVSQIVGRTPYCGILDLDRNYSDGFSQPMSLVNFNSHKETQRNGPSFGPTLCIHHRFPHTPFFERRRANDN